MTSSLSRSSPATISRATRDPPSISSGSPRSTERSLDVPAYVISEVDVVDETLAAEYRSLAANSIARYGGRYVIRGGAIENVEGDRPLEQRIVVVEFPTMKHAHDWYRSQEYAPALKLRATALKRRLTFVEGVPVEKPDDARAPDTTSVKDDALPVPQLTDDDLESYA